MTIKHKRRPPDLSAAALRWCQLDLCSLMLTSLYPITGIYVFQVCEHLSVSLLHPLNCLWTVPSPSFKWCERIWKRAASVTRMAFVGRWWVRKGSSVLNIKSDNRDQQSLTVSFRDGSVRQWECLNWPYQGGWGWGAAKRELMLFSFCFIGKQVRQVTMQFAFPCSL